MIIKTGLTYHIKDCFFEEMQEPTLMSNKEDGNYRPHFLAVQDDSNSNIFWMIPISSKVNKYRHIYQKQIIKYNKCTKIVLGKCDGCDAAFLIQNAFPTTADYFNHIHTSKGKPLVLHETTKKLIIKNLQNNLRLHKHGIPLFFADIDRIFHLMEKKLIS